MLLNKSKGQTWKIWSLVSAMDGSILLQGIVEEQPEGFNVKWLVKCQNMIYTILPIVTILVLSCFA